MHVDIYQQTSFIKNGELVYAWDYDNPETLPAKVAELSPEAAKELFSDSEYTYVRVIKVELSEKVSKASRVGNIRSNGIKPFDDTVFNIDNVKPRIDYKGNVVGYILYCRNALTL